MLIKRAQREARRGTLATKLPEQANAGVDRRAFLRRSGLAAGALAALGALPLGAGAGVAVTAAAPLATEARADSETNDEKRKARYKADSAEVQTFYRVNRYPS